VLAAIDPGLRLVRSRPMAGGVSAVTTLIEAEPRSPGHDSPGSPAERLVLRQHCLHDDAASPHIPATCEYQLLATLRAAGVPVPRPRLADGTGTLLPAPFVVTEFVDGTPVTQPPAPAGFTRQLAGALADLHSAVVALADVPFLPDIRDVAADKLGTAPQPPDDSVSEAEIRAALAASRPPGLVNRPTLLHGDYWPGNTLWRDGTLVALVDWEDAAAGDPLADLGNIRLELAMAFGTATADALTSEYVALMPALDVAGLPWWDLYAALRPAGKMADWGLPAEVHARFLTGHREFAQSARQRL
jgi:aminoglycoside phosphotransferase (APT) family kinase protein